MTVAAAVPVFRPPFTGTLPSAKTAQDLLEGLGASDHDVEDHDGHHGDDDADEGEGELPEALDAVGELGGVRLTGGFPDGHAFIDEFLGLDRVGGGDSFASGLSYGLISGQDLQTAVEYGAAHGALAMTTPGDTTMATKAEILKLAGGGDVALDSKSGGKVKLQGGGRRASGEGHTVDCGTLKVTAVANVGEQRPNADAKVFEVKVLVQQTDTTLRPGMTTSNAIETLTIKEALYVPLEAVVNEGGQSFVYKRNGSSAVRQQVETGAMSDDEVVVVRGLAEGDRVLLSPPADAAKLETVKLPGSGNTPGPGRATTCEAPRAPQHTRQIGRFARRQSHGARRRPSRRQGSQAKARACQV